MFEAAIAFLRKHTTITNRAVLAVYGCAMFYRMAYTLFLFSIIRFLKEGLGDNFLLIGALWAGGNIIMILIDLPLGSLQKYFKPRYFLLLATGSLFISALVFVLAAELSLWLAAVAMFFFQLSVEIYFVVISTSILRLSDDKTYAQNISQQSIFDNTGKVLGLAAGGALFFVDRALGAESFLVAFSIAVLSLLVTLYIYFAIDVTQYNRLEKTILELKPFKVAKDTLSTISDGVVVPAAEGPKEVGLPPFSFTDFVREVQESAVKLSNLVRNVRMAPVLAWGMVMLMASNWWYNSISTFEPVFIKEIFRKDTGWIADNVPRYFFESMMLIMATIIPTVFALPLGKLADWWGKWKMAVLATLISGVSIMSLFFFQSTAQVFVLYLVMAFGFVAITPALTGLLGQEFKALNTRLRGGKDAGENSEGESAGVISIAINIGEIGGGLFGGFMLSAFGFGGTFLFFGPFLILSALVSVVLFTTVFNRMKAEDEKKLVAEKAVIKGV